MALYHMTTINMQIDFGTAAMYRVYQTVGLAFLFIPISTLAYMGIPRHKSNQVAGMNNFMRNLGGSIGISMLSTWLQRLSQKHQVYLSAHATAGDPLFTQRITGLTQTFTSQGIPANEANARAYSLLGRTISGQASMLAYVDIISIMAVVILCLVPLAFLMQRPPKNASAGRGAFDSDFGHAGIAQFAQPFDLTTTSSPGVQPAGRFARETYPRRRAGHDNVSRFERHHARKKLNRFRNLERSTRACWSSASFSPFSVREMLRLCGSSISSAVTRYGPIGAKVSKFLPMVHCDTAI